MRVYMATVKLHHISPTTPDVCVKCLTKKGTLIHCQWKCPKIWVFWENVAKCLSHMVKCDRHLTWCHHSVYLEYTQKDFKRTTKQSEMIDFGRVHTRRVIVLLFGEMSNHHTHSWTAPPSLCLFVLLYFVCPLTEASARSHWSRASDITVGCARWQQECGGSRSWIQGQQ